MNNLLLLLVCFAAGVGARRYSRLPTDSYRVINGWVLNVSLPALVLRSVHAVELVPRLFLGAAMLWVEFGLAAALALIAVRKKWATPGVAGALALCGGLGNTAFVGLPLVESLGGAAAVPPAAFIDQLGTFGVFSLVAVPFAVALSGGRPSAGAIVMRVLKFPPFIALLMALASRSFSIPGPIDATLSRLADMLSPLALASVGWQLDLSSLRGLGRRLAVGLAFKLVVAPALVLGVLWLAQGTLGLEERVAIVESGMAPMVTAGVLAAEHRLEPVLASAMVAVGLLVSLVTVPLWWVLAGAL